MFEWKLFMPDEKETYPEVGQAVLLADFRGILKKPTPAELKLRGGEYHWTGGYIGEATKPMMWIALPGIPMDPEIVEIKRCGGSKSCEFRDGGYCFDKPEDFKCEKIRIVHGLFLK